MVYMYQGVYALEILFCLDAHEDLPARIRNGACRAGTVALLCDLLPDLALQLGLRLPGLSQFRDALLARPRRRSAVACRWPL